MIGYVKHFDSNKTIFLKVGDKKLLKSTKNMGTNQSKFQGMLDSVIRANKK